MHAVFALMDTIQNVDNCRVYLFDTEADAEEFVFGVLVEAGRIGVCTGGWYDVEGERHDTKQGAIDAAQYQFEGSEFLHIYPVSDRRSERAPAP